jgi:N-acyl-D-amino-acid deacylase
VAPGAAADLVCFDPATVRDNATYEDPRRPASGFVHVFVNGRATVRDGRRTDELPGRSLRGAACRRRA